ncbi:MAG: hypothetical protein QOJ89_1685 [bacterium]
MECTDAPHARTLRACLTAAGTALALLAGAAPAHAVGTIAADTTRSLLRDPLAAGRSPALVAGGLDRTLLRFRVHGLSGRPARALLRLRVTDGTFEGVQVRLLPSAFGEDDRTPTLLLPDLAAIAKVAGAKVGTWAEWDVTSAVAGDGDVNLQVSGPLLDAVGFSSREGPDAPQLVITPDDAAAVKLADLLDPRLATSFDADVKDNLGRSLDGLDVIAAPAGSPSRYIGVHHSLVGGVYLTQLASSDDLRHWTHVRDLDAHASQPSIVALPDGGYLVGLERDTPDAQYVSTSNLVVHHYASWAALAGGAADATANIPRTLAQTAEGTPALEVVSWNGVASSQIAITFHYLKNISVDRQASGTLTNFASWAPVADTTVNDLFIGLGTRGNLGDRAELAFEGHRFAVLEAQSIKGDFGSWRWYLYDRDRAEARLLALHAPAGSYAFGNPTVKTLPGPDGQPLLLVSGYAFAQGAAPAEAGQFIALRRLP